MRRRDFLRWTAAAAFCIGSTSARPAVRERQAGERRFGEIDRLIEEKMQEYRVPGVAFGLLKNGALFTRGFGVTNLDNPQPVTADTVFPIMSITKIVVTVAILRLVDRGRMDLDAPVRQYLPSFRVGDEEASRTVTIRHLLTHAPGWEGQLEASDRGDHTLAHFVEGMAELPQLARPGELWSYNNAGFDLAGHVVEMVTGMVIHDALRELVFAPLGLDRAFTRTGTAMTYRFAAPHSEKDGQSVVSRPFSLPSNIAAGGAAMRLRSLMDFARFHLGDGTASAGGRILSRAALELMRTPQLVKRPTSDEMGVGWHVRRIGGVETAVQCGSGPGHCLHLQIVPQRDLAFAILTNHARGWRLNSDVERAVLAVYEDLALAPNQTIGADRGGFEDMTRHATPLPRQPDHGAYLGRYERRPEPGWELVSQGGRLILGGAIYERAPLVFWAPDQAYVDLPAAEEDPLLYRYRGPPVEFIRDADGQVSWIRALGRIARRV